MSNRELRMRGLRGKFGTGFDHVGPLKIKGKGRGGKRTEKQREEEGRREERKNKEKQMAITTVCKEHSISNGEWSHFKTQIWVAQRSQQVTNLQCKCKVMSSNTKQLHKKLGMASCVPITPELWGMKARRTGLVN